MWQNRLREEKGVTLIELTMAMALFAIVLGATTQSLVSYYVALDEQNQRNTAVQHCAAVLSSMRDVRDANPANFPGAITAKWPNGGIVANVSTLPKESVTVNYVNPAANPLQVTLKSSWTDIRRHPMSLQVTTLLTDR